ncbi:hypothetical protein [Anaerospora hongkongensis]|uniref:hypothetical protein n=1 Tax=Anaerospora hongkongensis TaxID=244830 RepID=UPI00289DF385|nr:hypothetical protein [Anaerospora hongkongensis]
MEVVDKGVITINTLKFYAKMLLPVLLEAGELYLLVWLLTVVWRNGLSLPVQIAITGFCVFWSAIRMRNVYTSVRSTWNGFPWWLADRYKF